MKKISKKKLREFRFQAIIEIIMIALLILAFVPILLTLFMSTKTNWEIYNDFFGLPKRIIWENYVTGFKSLYPNMVNTLVMILVAVVAVLILSVMGGYVFGTKKFPGKNFLYMAILILMMIPGSISFAASYVMIIDYGLLNNRLAVILPWIAGGVVMGIILCRNSIESIPKDLFEAAIIDGCGDFRMLWDIVVPLSKPILSTLAIMKVVDYYNDYIWPMLVIQSNEKQLITVVLKVFTSTNADAGLGIVYAGYIIASIPMLVLFVFTSRLYMEGLTAGAVKG